LQSVFVVFAICVCCTLFAICVCCTLFALCICCICNMCLLYFICNLCLLYFICNLYLLYLQSVSVVLYLQSVFVVLYLHSVFVVLAICICCTCNLYLLYFLRAYFYTQTHDIASFDPVLNGCVFSFIFLTDYACTNCFLNQSLTQYSSDINIHCHYISTFIILHSSSKNKTNFLTQTSPPILLFIVLWHVYPTR